MGRIRQIQSHTPPPPPPPLPPPENAIIIDDVKEERLQSYLQHVPRPPSPEIPRKEQSDGDNTNLVSKYRRSLINEDIVIVEKNTSVSEEGNINFTNVDDGDINNDFVDKGCEACKDERCGYFTNCPGILTRSKSLSNLRCPSNNQSQTSSCCVDVQELPEPNTVRRVKDVFESLAIKFQETVKNEERPNFLKRRATLSESWYDKPTPTYDNVRAKWNFDDRQLNSSNSRKTTKLNQSSDTGSVSSESSSCVSPPSSPLSFRKAKEQISCKMSVSSNEDSAIVSDLSSTLSTMSSPSPSCASSSAGDSRPSSPNSTLRLTFAQLRQHHESLSINESVPSGEKYISNYLSQNKFKDFYSSNHTPSPKLPELTSQQRNNENTRINSQNHASIPAKISSQQQQTNIISTINPLQRKHEIKSPPNETSEELLNSLTETKPNPISRSRSFNMLQKIGQDSSQLPEWIQSIRDKFAKWEAVDSEFRKNLENKLNKKFEVLPLSESEPTCHKKPSRDTKLLADNYKNVASDKIKSVMEALEQSSDMKYRNNGKITENKTPKEKAPQFNNCTSNGSSMVMNADTEWFDSISNDIKTMVVGVVRKETKQWESNHNDNNGLEAKSMTKSFSSRDLRTAAWKDDQLPRNGSPDRFDNKRNILNSNVEYEEYDRYTTTSSEGDVDSEYQYDSDGAISLTEGFLEQRATVKPILNGIWLRNPIWHGSSYIVYDFRGRNNVTPHIRSDSKR